jgi:hypothetical protein
MRLLLAAAAALSAAQAWVLPGYSPQSFNEGDKVELKVNKLTSPKTHLGYEYYTLKYCKPAQVVSAPENLGEHLTGETIENSMFDVSRVPAKGGQDRPVASAHIGAIHGRPVRNRRACKCLVSFPSSFAVSLSSCPCSSP